MRHSHTIRSPHAVLGALRRLSFGVAVAALATAAAPALAVSPLEPSFQLSTTPSCAASVSIFEAKQTSPNIRVGFSWQTVGATSVWATVRMYPHGSNTPVFTSTLSVSPPASGSVYTLITPPPQGFPSGLYRVRVNLTTDCLAGAQSETFVYYTAP